MNEAIQVLHEKNRLIIISFLAALETQGCPFTVLQKQTGLTAGNLSSHLSTLEKHQLITITKSFEKRKPQTKIQLTLQGKECLEAFIESMEALIKKYRASLE